MAIRPHLNPAKGSQDFFWYGTVNLKCVFALGSDSVRNTAQFSIYGLFFYFENIISVVSLLEWEVGFDCFFVMLILWSQPNLDITWIMIPSYASSLSTVKIGHHRITEPNQCNKIFLFGVYAWEGKNSADQLRILCLYKAGCMFYVACLSSNKFGNLWNHKGCKVSVIVGKICDCFVQ